MKRRRVLVLTLTVIIGLCAACGMWLRAQRRQYVLNRRLIEALMRADTKTALALVNTGADPNTRQSPAPAPSLKSLLEHLLHGSSPSANATPTAFLFACGAYGAPTGDTPLYMLMPEEDRSLLQAMLAHGADVQFRTTDNRTSLHYAVDHRRLYTAELLLAHGVDINMEGDAHDTPLMQAVLQRDVEMTRLLLTHGAKPNVQNADGMTALAWAVFAAPDADVVRELLAHGADPNIKNRHGDTPLTLARQYRVFDLLPLMQRRGK